MKTNPKQTQQKEQKVNIFKSIVTAVVVVVGLVLVGGFFFWLLCLNHVNINEVGIAYNSLNGDVTVQDVPGWHYTSIMTKVVTISTLPHTVHIPSSAVVINTKVVKFNPKGAQEFIRMQGFSYSLPQSMENILMGYAFSGSQYSFLEVVQQAGPEASVRPNNVQAPVERQ